MCSAKKQLEELFPGITFTDVVSSPAYGMESGTPDYANMLAKGVTSLTLDELMVELKRLERVMGDTKALRQQNIVMMDLDLLKYNGERYHHDDWDRPYIKTLLNMIQHLVFLCVILCSSVTTFAATDFDNKEKTKKQDAELLGKAMDYYNGGKYHESILAFEKLSKSYRLTARIKACLGMSYFKERQYEEAVEILKPVIPELTAFSPKEQAVYAYSCAESLFYLERYSEAIEYYNKALPMTEERDRGDVLYHLAFSYFKLDNYQMALDNFNDSIVVYEQYATDSNDTLHKARIAQIKNMTNWLKNNLNQ